MIEKLKQQNDLGFPWIDEEGISHRSKFDYLFINVLGFCGCGDPKAIMIYIRDFLLLQRDGEWCEYDNLPFLFLCYWADANGFLEHGTTVRCGWLTEKGEELLKDLNWCIDNEE